jgi:ABC-type molybdate transport system substrate-binding protein
LITHRVKTGSLRRIVALIVGACLLASLAPACTAPSTGEGNKVSSPRPQTAAPKPSDQLSEPVTLRVLAGSEVKDMAGVLEEAAKATNVHLTVDYTGTLEGAKTVAAGKAAGKYDLIWFSSNRYLSLIPDASKRIAASIKIMASPVVLGVNAVSPTTWDGTRKRRPGMA